MKINANPFLVVALTFIGIMFLGGSLLIHPWSSSTGTFTDPVDALFTSASALFITGLAVVETGSHWSGLGQVIILILIQIGALGVVTISGYGAHIFGRKLIYADKQILSDDLGIENKEEILNILKEVMFYILIVELVGAILLFLAFFIHGYSLIDSIRFGVFHAISAFANAGFDIFALGDSGKTFIGINFASEIIMSLIIIGGLGYPVWLDLLNKIKFGKNHRLTYYSKLIIWLNFILILVGLLAFWSFEYSNRAHLVGQVIHFKESLFHSVSARTAGFSVFNLAEMTQPSLIVMMALMYIGGSPASTAGGIKVISIFILILMMKGLITGDFNLQFKKRSFDYQLIGKVVSSALISFILVVLASIVIELFDDPAFLDVMFEGFSAMGTVGLSLNLTPHLSDISKLMLMILMFMGRIGLYVLLYGYIFSSKKRIIKNYPKAKICL